MCTLIRWISGVLGHGPLLLYFCSMAQQLNPIPTVTLKDQVVEYKICHGSPKRNDLFVLRYHIFLFIHLVTSYKSQSLDKPALVFSSLIKQL